MRAGLAASGLTLALISSLAGAGSSEAALPRAGAAFKGSGGDYWNNQGTWTKAAESRFSFKVSHDRRRILGFHGTYSFYCGSGALTMSASWIAVARDGTFSYRFHAANREAATGQVTGRDWYRIYGRFTSPTSVRINYLFDFDEGKPVSDPYNTSAPHSIGCASWVRAAARTGR